MTLKVGLIGAGSIASLHLRAYAQRDDVEVAAIVDKNPARRAPLAEEFSIKKKYDDYRAILADEEIDLVDIILPHYLHHPVTLDALRAGKDVILDKPIAMSLEEADEMIETARSLGRRFFVVLNQRFVPAHRKARDLLEQGAIGKPYRAIVYLFAGNEFPRMNDPQDWKGTWDKGGGAVLFDSGVHLVDLMHYYFGDVRSVTALYRRLVVEPENKADDNTSVILEFKNGMMVDLHFSYSTIPNEEKKSFYGTEGTLVVNLDVEEPLTIMKGNLPHDRRFHGIEIEKVPVEHQPGWDWWGAYSMKGCLDHFIDCMLEGKEATEVTLADARRVLQTILAAYKSSNEGLRVCL